MVALIMSDRHSGKYKSCDQEARLEVSDRSQLAFDKFPLIPIGSLAQILDENWFLE
ncbi:hypothetical protein VB711_17705 [Cronbergia sp. UHCC 0137]|uniref:hypothetical protein n=1 Tax=Cronbergia sp. UHCC 0137 TaxID=3110239 RepID=UPI002B21F0B3|nr:hypothetical protein [Cronbergia sp. UHCC 0137]MEA5619662.1 hypothetical protein [Cronbergia sp. UHCC 0137]